MSKRKSGLILLGVGLGLQAVERLVQSVANTRQDVVLAGLVFALMFASVVVMLFGIYRIVTGSAENRRG